MFDRMRQQLRELEDKDLQIFEAQAELELVQKARKEKEARLVAVEEERRVVGIELHSAIATRNHLQETLAQRRHTAKYEQDLFIRDTFISNFKLLSIIYEELYSLAEN